MTITTLEAALERIAYLEEENAYLRKRNLELEERIERLERLLSRDSNNSHKPPSSRSPWKRGKPSSKPSGDGKPGAVKGHKGHSRARHQEVDEVQTHRPHHCKHCQAVFSEGRYVLQPTVARHQVVEIPEPKVHVTEHRMMRYRCRRCQRITQAPLPPEVSRHGFGPRLCAMVGSLAIEQRLSHRQIQVFFKDTYPLRVSTGSVASCVRRCAGACEAAAQKAHAHVQKADVKNADETSWFERHALFWLWVVCTKWVSVFIIDKRRNQEASHRLLGDTESQQDKFLCADRYGGYAWWKKKHRQFCWAHLRREFVAMSERKEASGFIGQKLLELTDRLFALQRQYRTGVIDLPSFHAQLKSIQKECVLYLRMGKRTSDKDTVRICKSLLKDFRCLWVFAQDPMRIDCHNNEAERSLRHAVILRKLSHGTQTQQGSRDKAILLTVQGSCKKQKRSLSAFLYDSLLARQLHHIGPSLIPT